MDSMGSESFLSDDGLENEWTDAAQKANEEAAALLQRYERDFGTAARKVPDYGKTAAFYGLVTCVLAIMGLLVYVFYLKKDMTSVAVGSAILGASFVSVVAYQVVSKLNTRL